MQAPHPGQGTFQALALRAEELGKESPPSMASPQCPSRRPQRLTGLFDPYRQVPGTDSSWHRGVKEGTQPVPRLALTPGD